MICGRTNLLYFKSGCKDTLQNDYIPNVLKDILLRNYKQMTLQKYIIPKSYCH
jgi:hypothetical protein